ncbi:MAG TPA: hypothetical protein VG015_08660 [Candidatus Dormibacteraeota bacterium]|jgi:hypothetical protein|nr:hypothetical protein [Candidatus Dormibacteraeota bacterium]
MPRLLWVLLSAVLVLAGWDMLLEKFADWLAWIVLGVGLGIGLAVIGSLAHDALIGNRNNRF